MATSGPMIFINISVTSIEASMPFYKAMGFVPNPKFTDAETAMVSLAPMEHAGGAGMINVMLHQNNRMKMFMPADREICNPKTTTEVLLCLSTKEREGVDEMIAKTTEAGGTADIVTMPQMEGMYGRCFADPDGHIWEVTWMSAEAVDAGPANSKEEK